MQTNILPLAKAKGLDREAMVRIYEMYSPAMFRYAYRLLGDPDLAEECVAETFSRFLHALHAGRGPNENLQAYLYKVAHNWITDHYRRQPPAPIPLEGELQADSRGSPPLVVAHRMERERVRAALMHLTSDQQRVIVLRFLEDWSHEEIAASLGKTVGATRVLQHRALATLRRLLLEQEE